MSKSQSIHRVFFFCLAALLPGAVAHAQEIELPPAVAEGSAADVLLQDPVVPVREGKPAPNTGTVGVERSLLDDLALPISASGPGELANFRGLGRSSEDTNVQTLGIPLNGPQGGGFD